MKLKTCILFLLIAANLFSQDFPIEWGPILKSSGALLDIIPKNNTSFYSLRWSGGGLGSYRIVEHDNMEEVQKARIKPVINSSYATVESVHYHGGKLIVFLSDKANGMMGLYSQELGPDLLPTDNSNLIAEYANPKMGSKPNFTIISSQNRKYLGVVWKINGKKEE